MHLARAYARTGHAVKVFTSAASVDLGGKAGKIRYREGRSIDEKYGYEILRLPALSFRSKAFSLQLGREVDRFAPDLLLLLGVAKGFPLPLLNASFAQRCRMVSIYGDAKEYLERNTLRQKVKALGHEAGYKILKQPLYARAVKYCHRIVLNIPESDDYFRSFLGKNLLNAYEQKKMLLNLGFDPDQYFFDFETRERQRAELGVKHDETLLVTSTRINRRKNLEKVIRLVNDLNAQGKKIKYILAGFMNDEYERELKDYISKLPFASSFLCFPFQDAEGIRRLYCAADAGLWLKAAISIQEAMGTGLPVILENKPSVNHLIREGHNGWFFGKSDFHEKVSKVLTELASNNVQRETLSRENGSWLSYDSIAEKIRNSLF